MKLVINKKHFIGKCLMILISVLWLSCQEDNEVTYNESDAIIQEVPDPYLQIKTPVVGFQAGTEKYGITFNAINGTKAIDEIKVYSVFTDAGSGMLSNETLLTTFTVDDPIISEVTDSLTYADLKAGLTVNGSPLPADEVDLKVGSGWKLRFEGVTKSGDIIPLAGSINIAVLSRFAGIYKVKNSAYYRIGELTGDWNNETRFIGSVDETTFSYNDYWGYFPWTGNQFNFTIDFDDNSITVPITVDGLFSGTRAINCKDDPGLFTNVPCDGSNKLVPDDVNGIHKIYLTYGYFTDGSGAREFYEELEKVVN